MALHVERLQAHPSQYDLGKAYTLVKRPGLLPKACTRHLHPADEKAINICLLEALLLRLPALEDLSLLLDDTKLGTPLFDQKKWRDIEPQKLLPRFKDFVLYNHKQDQTPNLIVEGQYVIHNQKLVHIESDVILSLNGLVTNFPYLEELSVFCEGMLRTDMQSLVAACPGLRKFDFHGGQSGLASSIDDTVHVRDIIELLEPRHQALEELAIHFILTDEFLEYVRDYSRLPDIRHFKKLRMLDVDFEALLDNYDEDEEEDDIGLTMTNFSGKLPRSLEKLSIFKADSELGEGLEGLADAKSKGSAVSSLKVVDLVYYQEGFSDDPNNIYDPELHQAEAMLKECGVKLMMSS